MLQGFIFTGLLLVFIGLMVKKHPNILAGYNTMSGEMKKKIDIECNLHPHNYYLEILTETGLIGFFIVLIIFIKSLHQSFYKKYFLAPSHNNKIIIPFIFLFFVEIFPIKSTGSFFTTGNASYIFLILAILIGLSKKHYYIENKY